MDQSHFCLDRMNLHTNLWQIGISKEDFIQTQLCEVDMKSVTDHKHLFLLCKVPTLYIHMTSLSLLASCCPTFIHGISNILHIALDISILWIMIILCLTFLTCIFLTISAPSILTNMVKSSLSSEKQSLRVLF